MKFYLICRFLNLPKSFSAEINGHLVADGHEIVEQYVGEELTDANELKVVQKNYVIAIT
jgi:hypothetical protein